MYQYILMNICFLISFCLAIDKAFQNENTQSQKQNQNKYAKTFYL